VSAKDKGCRSLWGTPAALAPATTSEAEAEHRVLSACDHISHSNAAKTCTPDKTLPEITPLYDRPAPGRHDNTAKMRCRGGERDGKALVTFVDFIIRLFGCDPGIRGSTRRRYDASCDYKDIRWFADILLYTSFTSKPETWLRSCRGDTSPRLRGEVDREAIG